MLLNIPPQKTLLRRHLGTNFSSLVGSSAQLEKRDYLEATGHSPLSTTAKVKVRDAAPQHHRQDDTALLHAGQGKERGRERGALTQTDSNTSSHSVSLLSSHSLLVHLSLIRTRARSLSLTPFHIPSSPPPAPEPRKKMTPPLSVPQA